MVSEFVIKIEKQVQEFKEFFVNHTASDALPISRFSLRWGGVSFTVVLRWGKHVNICAQNALNTSACQSVASWEKKSPNPTPCHIGHLILNRTLIALKVNIFKKSSKMPQA